MIKLLSGMGFHGRLAFQTSVFLSFFCLQTAYSQSFLTGYQFRNAITIQGSLVGDGESAVDTENFTNFPVLVLLTGTDYTSSINDGALADGSDIAFTDNDGTTVLDFEVVSYDEATDILQAWVQVPTLTEASDKIIYLYYGNPAPVITPITPWNTADNGFEAVWHFDDDVVTTNTGVNSTDEGATLNVTGDATGNDIVSATGQIGNAFSFPGTDNTDDWLSVDPGGTALDISGSTVSVSVWINPNDQGQSDDNNSQFSVLEKSDGTGGDDGKYWIGMEENNGDEEYFEVRVSVTGGTGDLDIDDDGGTDMLLAGENNGWYYLTMVYDGTNLIGYLNSVLTLTGPQTTNVEVQVNDILRIGARADDRRYNGLIDEVRVASVARTQAWVLTEFNNQVNPSTTAITPNTTTYNPFIALGATELALDITFESSATFLISPDNTVTFTITGTDFDGNATFDLQDSPDNVTFTDVVGFIGLTSTSFTSPTISVDTYFRIDVTNAGAADENFISSSIFIDAEPAYAFSTYTNRRCINFDEALVFGEDNVPIETAHTNFPVLISFTDTNLRSVSNGGNVASEDGYDIIFTDSDGSTLLDHDLESYNPATGQVVAWVEVLSLDTQNDDNIFTYYGNGSITAAQSTSNTWNNGFEGVWHMNQDPTITHIFDFSGSNNNAVPTALESNDLVAAKIGNGIDLDGFNADGGNLGEFFYVGAENVVPAELDITGQNITVSGWINPSIVNNNEYSIIEKANDNQDVDIAYWLGRDTDEAQARLGTPETAGNNLRLNSTQNIAIGTWSYIAMTYDGGAGGNNFIVYIDGQVGNSDNRTGNIISNPLDEFFIGGRDDGSDRFFDGTIDELRVATSTRSPGWIQTEYENQNTPSTFLTLKDERGCPDPVDGGIATATDAAIFIGETTSIVLADQTLGANIQWQESTDGLSFSDIGGETGTQVDVGPLTVTTHYRAQVSNASCTAYSTVATVDATEAILAGYSFRKCININPAQVIDDDADNVLLNFPILIDIRNDTDLSPDNVDRNGDFAGLSEPFPLDIVFSDVAGNLLTFEMEEFSFNGGASGNLRAWVRVPSLSTVVTTKIFLNYGNCNVVSGASPSVTDDGNSVTNSTNTNTWTNNFVAIWHLEDETSITDATANNLDGTIVAGPLVNATGQIGDGIDFPGTASSEYVRIGGAASAPSTVENFASYTLSGWVNTAADNDDKSFIELSDGTNTNNGDLKYFVGLEFGDIQVRASVGTTAAQSVSDDVSIPLQDVNDGTWHYVAAIYDGSEVTTYVDGSFIGVSDNTSLDGAINSDTNDELRLGARNDTRRFDGSADELRIADTNRGAGWIQTEYNNQFNAIIDIATPANNGNFYTLSAEESFVLWTDDDGGNSNWSDTDNWGICRAPNLDETVRIPDPATISGNNPTFDVANDEIGGLLIEANGDLNFNPTTNTLTLNGDLTNNSGGTFSPPGTITMGGTAIQSIQGNDGSIFGTLVVDNTAGVNIDQLTTINTSLTFTNGFVTLTDDTLSIASTGQITNASSSSFVITPFDNCLLQQSLGIGGGDRAGDILFPVGTSSTSYTPTTLNNIGTTDNYCIRVDNTVWSEGFIGDGIQQTADAIDKTWFIEENANGGSDVTLTLQWNAVNELTSFDRSDMFITHYVGSSWTPYETGLNAAGSDPYTASTSGVSSFSPVSAGSGSSVLPIELGSFEALVVDNAVKLEWTTITETNNDFFTLERSDNIESLSPIGSVDGAGNSNELINYSYLDRSPGSGTNYYRLKQTDFDGKFSYSKIVVVDFEPIIIPEINVYPNPNQGSFNIRLRGFNENQEVVLELFSANGDKLGHQVVKIGDNGEFILPVTLKQTFGEGIIIMRISSPELSMSKRLILSR